MKKKTSTIAIALLLLLLIEGQSIINVKGETLAPIVMDPNGVDFDNVKIFSPKNEVYNVSSILLNFTVEAFMSIDDVGYSLDGGSVERATNLTLIRSEPNLEVSPRGVFSDVTYRGYLLLSNLSDGNHSVSVYQGYQYSASHEVYVVYEYSVADFAVDTYSPKISVLSPEPKVYNVSDISLNYTINEPCQKVEYSLDEQDNVTITDNTMLSNMTSGMHNVTVYGWDVVGNVGASETVNFTINLPLQNQTLPVSEIIIVASLVLIVATALTIILYRRRKTSAYK